MRELMFGDSYNIVGKYKKGGGQQRCGQNVIFFTYNGDIYNCSTVTLILIKASAVIMNFKKNLG